MQALDMRYVARGAVVVRSRMRSPRRPSCRSNEAGPACGGPGRAALSLRAAGML